MRFSWRHHHSKLTFPQGMTLEPLIFRASCRLTPFPLRSGSCPLFEVAAKPRRDEADRSVRAPLHNLGRTDDRMATEG